jgi:hypothetical protein
MRCGSVRFWWALRTIETGIEVEVKTDVAVDVGVDLDFGLMGGPSFERFVVGAVKARQNLRV